MTTWTELHKILKRLPPEQLIDLLKGLHDLSPQNKAWLCSKVLPFWQDSAYLEECRRKVIRASAPAYSPSSAPPTSAGAMGISSGIR